MRLCDIEEFGGLFFEHYSQGENAINAFKDALKGTREPPVEELARKIKAHCKAEICETCAFWRVGSDEEFCELSDGLSPCGWEV